MEVEFTIASFICIAIITLGSTVAIILWRFSRGNNTFNKILALAIVSVLWGLTIWFLIDTRLIMYTPHLYRTDHLSILIFAPLSYLYVRCAVTGKKLSFRDTIHAIPAVFYLIDYFPFFILDGQEKLKIISDDLAATFGMNSYDEGWLTPSWFHAASRYCLIGYYWINQVKVQHLLYTPDKRTRVKHSIAFKTWLLIFTGVQVFAFLPLGLHPIGELVQDIVILISIALPVAFTALWLLFRPEILYGLQASNKKSELTGITGVVDSPGWEEYTLAEQINAMIAGAQASGAVNEIKFLQSLNREMITNKNFLQHKYSIHDFSKDTGIPVYQVSYFLNRHLKMSFHDFLNRYRVEYCIERIKKGDARRFTLEALGYECGFNNRNSFTAAFKRFTGVTPSDYARLKRSSN